MSESQTPDDPQAASLDDVLDRLVAEYADRVAAGAQPDRRAFLDRAPATARPGLERCLKMIDAGSGTGPGAPLPLTPGARFDQYELLRELGRGGMAVVWLARDTALQRPAALKFLRPGLAFEPRHVDRFRREALAIAKLVHPNVVGVHGVGAAGGHHYIAMEYIEGPSLATVLEALPPAERRSPEDLGRAAAAPALATDAETFEQAIARLLVPVAEALEAAHALGVVHRDVKPSNILLRADGSAVVCDFGLAKGGEDPALSLSGEPVGTPYYMSPEQAVLSGPGVDHRTDLYSLGVTLYEALTGRRPFRGESALEVLEAIRTQLAAPLGSHVTRDADAVVRRAMARDPERRYRSAAAFADDLRGLAGGTATRARRDEGGPLRRMWTQMRFATSGQAFEYRSARTLLGLPLMHVYGGPRTPGTPRRVAKGWFAAGGERAIGLVAFSTEAYGGVAMGAFACGLVAHGALGIGLLAIAGLGLGLISISGLSVGYLAFGGVALGYAAVGGYARGIYAAGGSPHGRHVLNRDHEDAEAEAFFQDAMPRIFDWLTGHMNP